MKLNKKIILGTTTILTIATPLATVVSCGDKTTLDKTTIYLNKINTAIDNKQNSIIFPTTEDKRPTIKGILTKLGIAQDPKFDVSFENIPTWIKNKKTSIKFKVCLRGKESNSKVSKELQVTWKVVVQSQFTKYKIGSGKAITASVHDLSKIADENITITQIGFQTLKDETVQVDQMPKGVITVPKDLPSEITSTKKMFFNCSKFNQDLNNWNVSNVTNMMYMFFCCSSFNQDLSKWNVSNVTNMRSIFLDCKLFNKDISNWNVSNVKNMSNMFRGCSKYNKNLNNWNVSNVTNMSCMFLECSLFNKDINNWDVSNVTKMDFMFSNCWKFNQPLNNWNVSKVTNMQSTFQDCHKFNQPLNKWNVSNVTKMNFMLNECVEFNQDLDKWDVSNVTNMYAMFYKCKSFNKDIGKWNVSKVINMELFLVAASIFYQDLSKWDVSNIIHANNWVSWGSAMFPKSTPKNNKTSILTKF